MKSFLDVHLRDYKSAEVILRLTSEENLTLDGNEEKNKSHT